MKKLIRYQPLYLREAFLLENPIYLEFFLKSGGLYVSHDGDVKDIILFKLEFQENNITGFMVFDKIRKQIIKEYPKLAHRYRSKHIDIVHGFLTEYCLENKLPFDVVITPKGKVILKTDKPINSVDTNRI